MNNWIIGFSTATIACIFLLVDGFTQNVTVQSGKVFKIEDATYQCKMVNKLEFEEWAKYRN